MKTIDMLNNMLATATDKVVSLCDDAGAKMDQWPINWRLPLVLTLTRNELGALFAMAQLGLFVHRCVADGNIRIESTGAEPKTCDGSATKDELPKVQFYCPMCNNNKATMLGGKIFASPHEPVLQCDDCKTRWRLNLYDCGQEIKLATEEEIRQALDR